MIIFPRKKLLYIFIIFNLINNNRNYLQNSESNLNTIIRTYNSYYNCLKIIVKIKNRYKELKVIIK